MAEKNVGKVCHEYNLCCFNRNLRERFVVNRIVVNRHIWLKKAWGKFVVKQVNTCMSIVIWRGEGGGVGKQTQTSHTDQPEKCE